MTRAAFALAFVLAAAFFIPSLSMPIVAYVPTDGWPSESGWTQYGGSVAHSGRSPAVGPNSGSSALPQATFGTKSFSAPVIDARGHVYVASRAGVVSKYTHDLQVVWRSPSLGGEIASSVMVGPDGTVYVAPVGADLIALKAEDGKIFWRAKVENTAPAAEYVVTGAPAYHPKGLILQGSMNGKVYAFHPDGTQAWVFVTHTDIANNKVVSTPAITSDGTIIVGSQNARIYALTPEGKQRATFSFSAFTDDGDDPEQMVAAPSLGNNGRVFATVRGSGGVGGVYALKLTSTTFTASWSAQLDDRVTAPVTVMPDGDAVVGTTSGTVYRLDAAAGTVDWDFHPLDDDSNPPPGAVLNRFSGQNKVLAVAELIVTDAAGRLFVPYWMVDISNGFPPKDSLESPFYSIDAETGAMNWRRDFDKTVRSAALMPTPAAVNGVPKAIMYVAGDDGKLYAIGSGNVTPRIIETTSVPETPETPPAEPTGEPAADPEPASDPDTGSGSAGSGGGGVDGDVDAGGAPVDDTNPSTNATDSNATPGLPAIALAGSLVALLAVTRPRRRD